jgi:4-hydroxythreonine-4-phosphate dehydrogenase
LVRNQQRKKHKIIAITAGDPAGIGIEVSLKAFKELSEIPCALVLIVRKSVLDNLYPHNDLNFIQINFDYNPDDLSPKHIYLLNVELPYDVPVIGCGNVNTGAESLAYIDKAIELWLKGKIDSIVTGPVSKAFINLNGIDFRGHTEYFAEKTDDSTPYMMMFSQDYRVILSTIHIPLQEVTSVLSEEKILNVIRIADKSLRMIDNINKSAPKIAVAGLDPHCGDDGAIGNFDSSITQNAILEARKEGLQVEGPFAADTLFRPESWSNYSVVVAQYHDQGLIPFKMLAFDNGVNVTLGLELIRTSVDHGTAFNIAGKNIASHSSMIEAIKLAEKLQSI